MTTQPDPQAALAAALHELRKLGKPATLAGMARYAIPSEHAFGVSVGEVQKLAKQLGRNHDLALALWASGWYEARLLACYVDDPARVSAKQMDQWCAEFDNWAVCDTVCFALFDRTPHAWTKVAQWHRSKHEFVKRAAFALLWGLTVHDKPAADSSFERGLEMIEAAADDDRNFVKKAVNMALRAIGKRNAVLHGKALAVAARLGEAPQPSARWIGKDAARELASPAVAKRLAPKPPTPRKASKPKETA